MKVFLIDTENVGWQGIKGSESLSSSDEVYLFTTDVFNASKSFSLEIMKMLISSRAKFSFINIGKTNALKNYLDFQLCTFLGSFMERQQDAQAVIISKDKGYQSVVDYWHHNNREVYLAPDIKTHMSDYNKFHSLENNLLQTKNTTQPIMQGIMNPPASKTNLINQDNLEVSKITKEIESNRYKKHIKKVIKKHYPKMETKVINKRVKKLMEVKNFDELKNNCLVLFGKKKSNAIYEEIVSKYPYNI